MQKEQSKKQNVGRIAVVAAGVILLVSLVVWFLLSGFAVGVGAGSNGPTVGTKGSTETEADGQSASSSQEYPASTGWYSADRAGAQDGAAKQTVRSKKIVQVASQQIGNIGGRKFWSWYGYPGRVEWCACFVSWCADRCGYIAKDIIPKFSAVVDGVAWFADRGQWQGRWYTPLPGDIIFFDWQEDGICDHVGIVEKCDGERIFTVEGNSLNMCRRKSYPLGSPVIFGYGTPKL